MCVAPVFNISVSFCLLLWFGLHINTHPFLSPSCLFFLTPPVPTDTVVVLEEGGRGKAPDSDPESPQMELETTSSEPIFMSPEMFKPSNTMLSRVSDRAVGGI